MLLTIAETQQALRLGHSKVCQMIAAGELPSVKIGRARRIPIEAIRRLIANGNVEVAQSATPSREGGER